MIEFWLEKKPDGKVLTFIDGERIDVKKFRTISRTRRVQGLIQNETQTHFVAILPTEIIKDYVLKDGVLTILIKEKPNV